MLADPPRYDVRGEGPDHAKRFSASVLARRHRAGDRRGPLEEGSRAGCGPPGVAGPGDGARGRAAGRVTTPSSPVASLNTCPSCPRSRPSAGTSPPTWWAPASPASRSPAPGRSAASPWRRWRRRSKGASSPAPTGAASTSSWASTTAPGSSCTCACRASCSSWTDPRRRRSSTRTWCSTWRTAASSASSTRAPSARCSRSAPGESVGSLDLLGPEPLGPLAITASDFAARLRAKRAQLKPLLMDQRFVAGLGNIYSDEILWRARLRWDRRSDTVAPARGAGAPRGDGRGARGGRRPPGLHPRRRPVRRPLRAAGPLRPPPLGVRPGGPALPALRPSGGADQGRRALVVPLPLVPAASRGPERPPERRRPNARPHAPPVDGPPIGSEPVYLKQLTLKGFKSFADKTTLTFEPGVNVVVGPNGSGKSNLVDAVAWVLGAQGARALRGAKMDDVIFAGTPNRPALGRAEVDLLIDNSSGLLPVEYPEVRITRTLFRSGESDYHAERHVGAPVRHPGAPLGLGGRPHPARDRRPGPARRHLELPPRGPPLDHRGGRRDPEVPAPQGEGGAPARGHRGQPPAPGRPPPRGPPAAAAARAPGRGGPRARRPGRRAPGHPLPPGRPGAGGAGRAAAGGRRPHASSSPVATATCGPSCASSTACWDGGSRR